MALIVLEGAALAFLAASLVRAHRSGSRITVRGFLLAFLLASPLWLALVYLLPLPAALWAGAPGRAIYPEVLAAAGIATPSFLPLSLVPDATAASLFAGIPIVAAFVAGHWMRLRQLKLVLGVLAGVAILQVIMGLLQVAGARVPHCTSVASAAGPSAPSRIPTTSRTTWRWASRCTYGSPGPASRSAPCSACTIAPGRRAGWRCGPRAACCWPSAS
ncbi:hypothetical protein [Ramlibacter montanisoli]|uniref:Uncharacterized protein n=1 Tax=Ramlibacter montanisoli TaxID=2732512 RepID=A0A849KIR9_9BURK|nr:hypothetical protein [Ramlibacter montanisoli]NNU45316.1 hypothetical protein [Ramlibacter montanisoli]